MSRTDSERQGLLAGGASVDGSIFREIQHSRAHASGLRDYVKRVRGIVYDRIPDSTKSVLGLLILVTFGLGLPIAEIVMGSMKCTMLNSISRSLIGMGISGILWCVQAIMFTVAIGCNWTEFGNVIGNAGNRASILFLFSNYVWCAAATVMLFLFPKCLPSEDPITMSGLCFTTDPFYVKTDYYCSDMVYEFVYWDIIIKWVLLGLLIIFGFLFYSIFFCIYNCSSENEN